MFTTVFIRGVKKVVRQVRMRNDPVAYARSIGVRIGSGCRIYSANEAMWGSDPYLCTIGDCVHITDGVRFVTHDGGTLIFREEFPTLNISAPIVVGSRTYLGINTIILPGVTIGDRCVIGAGSVVSRNIPENSLAVGVPARVIKTADEYLAKPLKNSLGCGHLSALEKEVFLKGYYGVNHGAGGRLVRDRGPELASAGDVPR